jgi:hypothetical protein
VSSRRLEALNSLPSLTNILFHSSFRTSISATLSLEYQLFSSSSLSTFNWYFLSLSASSAALAFSQASISSSLFISAISSLDIHFVLGFSVFVLFASLAASLSLCLLSIASFSLSHILNSGTTFEVCSHITSVSFIFQKFSFSLSAKSDGFSSPL